MPNNIQLCHTAEQEDSYGQTRNLVNWSIRRGIRKEDCNYWNPSCCASRPTGDIWPGVASCIWHRPVVPPCCPLGGVGTTGLSSSVPFCRQQKPRVCWSTWGWRQGDGQWHLHPEGPQPPGRGKRRRGQRKHALPGEVGKHKVLASKLKNRQRWLPLHASRGASLASVWGCSEASVTQLFSQCLALLFRALWGLTMGHPTCYALSFFAQT